jgi:hypothetical protein
MMARRFLGSELLTSSIGARCSHRAAAGRGRVDPDARHGLAAPRDAPRTPRTEQKLPSDSLS